VTDTTSQDIVGGGTMFDTPSQEIAGEGDAIET
jgi:hypothetical protein